MTTTRWLYLIDGVGVPKKVFDRRVIFGEYAGASFRIVEVRGGYER